MVLPNKKAEQWEPICCCYAYWLSLYAMQRPSLLTRRMEQRRSPVRSPYGFTTRALVLSREYWIICRGLGFLAVLYDSAPRPPPYPPLRPPLGNLSLFLSRPVSRCSSLLRHVLNLVWFGYIARLSQWVGGGYFLIQMISTCLRFARGGGGGVEGQHPVIQPLHFQANIILFDCLSNKKKMVFPC